MTKINITCETCKVTHSVDRTSEIPDWVTSLGCNWCPACEATADDYYEEWYNEGDDNSSPPEPSNDPTQLCMPFLTDDILKDHKVKDKV